MGAIQVLSFEVANLIAAGEVVDRPASAVKEMMENAIDAKAEHITVEIQHGGVSFMRVTDDGCGMTAEDLPMAVRRHATSKIRSAEDLAGIATLGFRGEALAAISSVADMRILSKRREDPMGAMLEIRGGTVLGVSERGCQDGTTVIVENLFATVPARRKFLKRDVTEAMAVSANVERVALSHPEISVRFLNDGVQKLETAGDGQLKSAVFAVFGRDFASRLIPIHGEFDGICVSGFIGRSENVKSNRSGQNFFINHRYIKSRTAQAALEQAFTSYIPVEKYPVCVLNLEISPNRVDVNVHPAKLEVKFSNEKPVFEAVYYAVRQGLEQNTTRPPFPLDNKGHSPSASAQRMPGNRLSDLDHPVDAPRPATVRERQLTVGMVSPDTSDGTPAVPPEGSAFPKPPQEHITAEEYIARYVDRDRNRKKETTPFRTPVPDATVFQTLSEDRPIPAKPDMVENPPDKPETADPPLPSPDEDVPMEWYDREAERLFGRDKADTISSPPSSGYALNGDLPPERSGVFPDSETDRAFRPVSGAPDTDSPPTEADPTSSSVPVLSCPTESGQGECLPGSTGDSPTAPENRPYRLVGSVFHAYVIVEKGDRMVLIDQHAAHERLIFEKLKARMKTRTVDSQMLMFPVEVMLMSEEVGLLDSYRQELESIGFGFECQRNTVRVTSIPSGIETEAVPDMMTAFAEQLRDGVGVPKLTRDIRFEKALYQASCKAAIKAGRTYPEEHIQWLVDELMRLPDVTFCPHGRPVAMELSKHQLDHRFERC